MDRDQLLWGMYQEHVTQARQHEDQRERMTALVVAISAAAMAFVGESGLTWSDLLLSMPIVPLGIYGALFSRKHYERNRMHVAIAASYLKEIDPALYEPRKRAELAHSVKFKGTYGQRLHPYWEGILWAVAILGTITSVAVVWNASSRPS